MSRTVSCTLGARRRHHRLQVSALTISTPAEVFLHRGRQLLPGGGILSCQFTRQCRGLGRRRLTFIIVDLEAREIQMRRVLPIRQDFIKELGMCDGTSKMRACPGKSLWI